MQNFSQFRRYDTPSLCRCTPVNCRYLLQINCRYLLPISWVRQCQEYGLLQFSN